MERLNEVNLAWIGATPGVKFASSGMLIQKKLSDTDLSIPCIRAVILRLLSTGDAIVLSPGWASFDELRNFEHRVKSFQDLAFTCSSG